MGDIPAPGARELFSPKTERIISLVQSMFPILAALATAIWAVNGYFDEQKKNRAQIDSVQFGRFMDARKSFFELQLKTYVEIAETAGQLVATDDAKSDEWRTLRRKFNALHLGEFMLFGSGNVGVHMHQLSIAIQKMENKNDEQALAELRKQTSCLGIEMRDSLAQAWSADFGKITSVYAGAAAKIDLKSCER